MLREANRNLGKISPDANAPGSFMLMMVGDVWIFYGADGISVGCMYFVPLVGEDACLIHGGFWDKKLQDKKEPMQALIETRQESAIFCPLRRDRVGKVWAWWLKRNLDFEEVSGYDWLELPADHFVVERGTKCLQQ